MASTGSVNPNARSVIPSDATHSAPAAAETPSAASTPKGPESLDAFVKKTPNPYVSSGENRVLRAQPRVVADYLPNVSGEVTISVAKGDDTHAAVSVNGVAYIYTQDGEGWHPSYPNDTRNALTIGNEFTPLVAHMANGAFDTVQ